MRCIQEALPVAAPLILGVKALPEVAKPLEILLACQPFTGRRKNEEINGEFLDVGRFEGLGSSGILVDYLLLNGSLKLATGRRIALTVNEGNEKRNVLEKFPLSFAKCHTYTVA